MSWLIDGSNLLGAIGLPREDDASKRHLVRLLSRFARARGARVICFFDGPEPASFAKELGLVRVVFSFHRSADDLIAKAVTTGTSVVTRDRHLASKIGGRRVKIVDPVAFATDLESIPTDDAAGDSEDWMAYFSDPKNRERF